MPVRTTRAASLLLLAALLGACGGAAGRGAAVDARALCPPPDFEIQGAVDVAARCRHIVALADERLGLLHWPVSDVDLRWNICPPGARCVFLQLNQAWVIYRFSFGDPVMIHVRQRTGGNGIADDFVADAPEPLPDWLLEELEVEEGGRLG